MTQRDTSACVCKPIHVWNRTLCVHGPFPRRSARMVWGGVPAPVRPVDLRRKGQYLPSFFSANRDEGL